MDIGHDTRLYIYNIYIIYNSEVWGEGGESEPPFPLIVVLFSSTNLFCYIDLKKYKILERQYSYMAKTPLLTNLLLFFLTAGVSICLFWTRNVCGLLRFQK